MVNTGNDVARVEGVVQQIDHQSGFATVRCNAGTVQVFLPAFFGGQTAPYPKEGGHVHLRLGRTSAGSTEVLNAWAGR
jgi:hypothetical protein